jgi:hypothetical protein
MQRLPVALDYRDLLIADAGFDALFKKLTDAPSFDRSVLKVIISDFVVLVTTYHDAYAFQYPNTLFVDTPRVKAGHGPGRRSAVFL